MGHSKLKVMVLAGGPDRERQVSLMSGAEVEAALRQAGHEVNVRDAEPSNLHFLDDFTDWNGDVIFPMIHGTWGEGGPLQYLLDSRSIRYVGSVGSAADLCMDKHRAKLALAKHDLPTPPHELITLGQPITLDLPLVIKPPREGSSIDLYPCRTTEQLEAARTKLEHDRPTLMAEALLTGKELTVSVIRSDHGYETLPTIQIIPATDFYDYDAKYVRDDTQYLFDINLPRDVLEQVRRMALRAHSVLGCRHLSRVDFFVDEQNRPWIIELNTLPGFTSHSLMPMAAAHIGISLSQLVDRLVRLPLGI